MDIIKPGFYRLSNDDYHKGPGLSSTNLRDLLRSPAHMKERKENPPEPTPALIFGVAWHTLTLEEDMFGQHYVPLPEDHDGRNKEGKARIAEIVERGLIPLKHDDYRRMQAMAGVIRGHQPAIDLLSEGEPELSGYWYDPQDPRMLCKLRLDWINKPAHRIVDLKSCQDARPEAFIRDAYKLGYGTQAAWYCYGATQITGIEHSEFYFICVEKDPPHGVQVYRASDELLQDGLIRIQEALNIYARCLDTGEYPCYGDEVQELPLPAWARKQNDLGMWE